MFGSSSFLPEATDDGDCLSPRVLGGQLYKYINLYKKTTERFGGVFTFKKIFLTQNTFVRFMNCAIHRIRFVVWLHMKSVRRSRLLYSVRLISLYPRSRRSKVVLHVILLVFFFWLEEDERVDLLCMYI